LAGREGAASPISWWPVARAKVSIMCVVVMYSAQYAVLLCDAVVWCDRGVPVPVPIPRSQGGLRDALVQQQWS
jgi:hypothetical protein